jgi:hypothetical protein
MKKNLFAPLNAPYYVWIQPYREDSGGIRAMYCFCHALNLAGEEAYIVGSTPEESKDLPAWLRVPFLDKGIALKHEQSGRVPVAIYPEVVFENPLGALNVVRYLLNIPGAVDRRRPIKWSPRDLIYSHSMEIVPEGMSAEVLHIPLVNQAIYNSKGVDDSKRSGTLFWESRYRERGGKLLPITANSTEISFKVPRRTPEQLAALYRGAEVLYTYEPGTAPYEAMCCGCPVVFLPNDIWLPTPPKVGPWASHDGWAWGTDPDEMERAKRTVKNIAHYYDKNQDEFWSQLDGFIKNSQLLVHRNAAMAAFHSSDLGKSFEIFSDILDKDVNSPVPSAYLSFISAYWGEIQNAESFINKAMQIAPNRADLKAALGEIFLKVNVPELAVRYLQEAIAAQPNLFPAYTVLARSLVLFQRKDEAIDLLQSVANVPSAAQKEIQRVLSEILGR